MTGIGAGRRIGTIATSAVVTAGLVGVPASLNGFSTMGVAEQRDQAGGDNGIPVGALTGVGMTAAAGAFALTRGSRGGSGKAYALSLGFGAAIGTALGVGAGYATRAIVGDRAGAASLGDAAVVDRLRARAAEHPDEAMSLTNAGVSVTPLWGQVAVAGAGLVGGFGGAQLRRVVHHPVLRAVLGTTGALLGAGGAGLGAWSLVSKAPTGAEAPTVSSPVPRYDASIDAVPERPAIAAGEKVGTITAEVEQEIADADGNGMKERGLAPKAYDVVFDAYVGPAAGFGNSVDAAQAAAEAHEDVDPSSLSHAELGLIVERDGRYYAALAKAPGAAELSWLQDLSGVTITNPDVRLLVDYHEGAFEAAAEPGGPAKAVPRTDRNPHVEGRDPGRYSDRADAIAQMRLQPGDQIVVQKESRGEVKYYVRDASDLPPEQLAKPQLGVPAKDGDVAREIQGIEFTAHDGFFITPGEVGEHTFATN